MPSESLSIEPAKPVHEQAPTWSDQIAKVRPFGIDLFCFGKKFLLYNLVGRNMKIKYRRSVLGVLWTLVSPMALACVYYLIFEKVLHINIPHYLGFVFGGTILWGFFSGTVIEATESLVGNISLLSKIPIPIQVFPLVTTLTNFVTLILALPVLFGALLISHTPFTPSMFLLPVYLGILFVMTYAFSLIASLGFVYFRDLKHVMAIVMQIWFYATPVLFEAKMIPPHYRWIVYANPVGMYFDHIDKFLILGQCPPLGEIAGVFAWTGAILLIAVFSYRAGARSAVEIL